MEPFKSREERKKKIRLEAAREVGLELDEDGRVIYNHFPKYFAYAPWLPKKRPAGLVYRGNRFSLPYQAKSNGANISAVHRDSKVAFENCGAVTQDADSCIERPDENAEASEPAHDGKRDC